MLLSRCLTVSWLSICPSCYFAIKDVCFCAVFEDCYATHSYVCMYGQNVYMTEGKILSTLNFDVDLCRCLKWKMIHCVGLCKSYLWTCKERAWRLLLLDSLVLRSHHLFIICCFVIDIKMTSFCFQIGKWQTVVELVMYIRCVQKHYVHIMYIVVYFACPSPRVCVLWSGGLC